MKHALSAILAATVLATACAFAQSPELQRRAKAEGFVLAPAGEEESGVFPVEYTLEEGEEEGIYWPWGQKWPGMALGLRAGTTGLGAELTFGINRWLNLRGGWNWCSFEPRLKVDEVKFDADLDLDTADVMLDIHPFGGTFRISGGVYYHFDGTAALSATPQKEWTKIGNHRYQPATIGTMSGRATVDDDFVPYAGIGWGNNVGDDVAVTFALDLGVMFQSYTVGPFTATGSGAFSKDPSFRDDLAKEQRRVQDRLDDWKIYPVVTLSLAYHF